MRSDWLPVRMSDQLKMSKVTKTRERKNYYFIIKRWVIMSQKKIYKIQRSLEHNLNY